MTNPSSENWAALSPLLDELLDLPEAERSARVAEVRAHNPPLGDELAALLLQSQSAQVKDFLAKPLLNAVDQTPESTLAGQRLGAYVLESPLGQGGTGSVWRARREDGTLRGLWLSSCCTCHSWAGPGPSASSAKATSWRV